MKRKMIGVLFAVCLMLFVAACGSECQVNNEEHDAPAYNVGDASVDAPMISGSYLVYDSIAHLASAATYVIRVEVLDERVENLDVLVSPESEEENTGMNLESHYRIFTVYSIRVLEVFQGCVDAGDVIEVRLLGSPFDDNYLQSADHTYLTVGDDLVLFLQDSAVEHLPPFLVNPTQSTYRVAATTENAGIMSENLHEKLESINPNNSLRLTMEELLNLETDSY